jgi:hypothetical protein
MRRSERQRHRYRPSLAYRMAEQARSAGVNLEAAPGPWRASRRRDGLELFPVVTNGRTEIMVDTMGHAGDVAGLLNWCRLEDLRPVPDLVPPPGSLWVEGEALQAAG